MSWITPRTSQDLPFPSKDVIEREVKANLDYLKDAVDDNVTDIATNATSITANTNLLNDVSWAEPTRVIDTVYQNSTKIRLVSISVEYYSVNRADAKVGSSSPPTKIVAYNINNIGGTNMNMTMTFIVPPSYYYALYTIAGSPTIRDWHEWDLH